MRFECSDLNRALAVPELMPDALAHAKNCPVCRRELYLWNEISRLAPQLHEEWESPELWPRILEKLAAEPKPKKKSWWQAWYWIPVPVAAVALIVGLFLFPRFRTTEKPTRDFLTEQALKDVEQSEATYAKSIEKLSQLAGSKLEKTESPLAVSYHEKLLLLDSAIADVKANLERNRFNTQLRSELASLYRDKQKTLQEILKSESKN